MSGVEIARLALERVGCPEEPRFWTHAGVDPPPPPGTYQWCGVFALSCAHDAGELLGFDWIIGEGFLSRCRIVPASLVEPGDFAYSPHHQHHSIVVGLLDDKLRVVNGNGTGGFVTIGEIPRDDSHAFFRGTVQ